MKTPAPKIHLLDIDEPLLAFSNLTVRCGIVLQNAKCRFMRAEEMRIDMPIPFGVCHRCQRIIPEKTDKREYLYGLIEGQAARDLESESDAA